MKNVIWSKNAKEELLSVVEYWNLRNQTTSYSDKLKKHIEIAISLIKRHNEIGIQTNVKNVRIRVILKNFHLIYEIQQNQISILRFWDVRQNPIKVKFKRK